jgi:Domain of unknown function (DUF4340)
VNPRATLALLLLTALVLGGLFYLRKNVEPTRDAEQKQRYLAVFEPDDITTIDITRNGTKLSLRREGGEWRMTAPLKDRADPDAIDRLLHALRFMEVRDRQPGRNPANFPECGLELPRARIALGGAENVIVDLGAETALPNEIFAKLGGESSIARIPASILELATRPPYSFRDPRLTNLRADDVEKFTVRRADGEMTLRRQRGAWVIAKPVQAAADPRAVRAFLEPLLGLRVKDFGAQDAAPDTSAALPGQAAAISLTPRGGGDELELKLQRGGTNNAENISAFFGPRGGNISVDAAAAVLFDISPETLRDRSLGHVDIDTIDRIRVESDGKVVTLQRGDEGWSGVEDGRSRHGEEIADLVQLFNTTRVEGFRTAASAAETGLTAPAQKIIFYAWLSENSAEEAAGAHPIAGAEAGLPAPDGKIYARAIGSDETVTIAPELPAMLRAIVAPDNVNGPR